MRKLQDSFKGRGSQKDFEFTLIERTEIKALYKKEDMLGNKYYEAFIVKISPEVKFGDSVIEAHEAFPSDNQFGTYGICSRYLDRATEYYNNISYERKERD